ncbi:alpha-tocopherol transfer protein-like [Condylostylus longicornis]|uniref:alpha-tocopherol transfer protein-like n=1 Tax=Condylostylus longicornis TaxID=2530218 RepID=UPI00244E3670|nr:alpha-tocopherol transfer protein-like [Condylostylus longicornis]
MSERISNEDEKYGILKEFVKNNTSLPLIEENLLKNFLHCCDHNVESAKILIVNSYKLRSSYPQIFIDRDPDSIEIKQQLESEAMVLFPEKTNNGDQVTLYKLMNGDPSKFRFTMALKIFIMFFDVRCIIPGATGNHEITIFDMDGCSLKHVKSANITAIRALFKYLQEAITVKLKEIHLLNCPVFIDKIMAILKPFIRNDLYKKIRFHQPNSLTIYDYVPKELFPIEYGGNSYHLEDIRTEWVNKLKDNREYLINSENWKYRSNSSLFANPLSDGTFNPLNFD